MKPSKDIQRLIDIMAALRTPETGCPWDLQQDFASIAPYTIEEAYEVADAIARSDLVDLRDELGDLLLQVVFHARMAEEQSKFAFGDVVEAVTTKLIRRHPHVFGDGAARDPKAVKESWDNIKAAERAEKRAERAARGIKADLETDDYLAHVPVGLPALTRALKLQERAARVGFDWPDVEPVLDKIGEEIEEMREAARNGDSAALAEEFGDVLFALVNLGRHFGLDSEAALRGTNDKFRSRFRAIETGLAQSGRSLDEATLEEMEALWKAAKQDTVAP